MSSNKGHRVGGKYAKRHTTVTHAAEEIVDVADRLPCVSKISLGMIKKGGSKSRRLKIVEVPAGLCVVVMSATSTQILHIFTNDRGATQAALEKVFAS